MSESPIPQGFMVVETSREFGACVKKPPSSVPKMPPKKNPSWGTAEAYINNWLGDGSPSLSTDPSAAVAEPHMEDSAKNWQGDGETSMKSSFPGINNYAQRWLGDSEAISRMPANRQVPDMQNFLKRRLGEGEMMSGTRVHPSAQDMESHAKRWLAEPAALEMAKYARIWLGEPGPEDFAVPDLENQAETPKLSNFSGKWILSWVEGDMNAALQKVGIKTSMMPLLGGQLNYGVGLLFQIINQTGDNFAVETKMLGTAYSEGVAYRVGELEESNDSEYCATWGNPDKTEVIYDESRKGFHIPRYTRYMEGNVMVMWIDIEGVEVRQYWTRYTGDGPPYKGNIDEVASILQTME